MPYPMAPLSCRLCRELMQRAVRRALEIWDRGGKCVRCHQRNCYADACLTPPLEAPADYSVWATPLMPRKPSLPAFYVAGRPAPHYEDAAPLAFGGRGVRSLHDRADRTGHRRAPKRWLNR